jgi:Sugar efflux transporter for intercellular exchange
MEYQKYVYIVMFTILFNIGPIFQIVSMIQQRCSRNVSFGMYVCNILGSVCMLQYLRVMDVSGAISYINSILGIVLNIVVVVGIVVYRPRSSDSNKNWNE